MIGQNPILPINMLFGIGFKILQRITGVIKLDWPRTHLLLKLSDTRRGLLFSTASSAQPGLRTPSNIQPDARALRLPWCFPPSPSSAGLSWPSTLPPALTLPTLCPAWKVKTLRARPGILCGTAHHTSGENPTKLSHYLG